MAAKVIELKVNAAFLAAGLTSAGPFDASRADAYAEVIGTNVAGFTDLLARLIAIFRQQPFESSIIDVSSLAGATTVHYQPSTKRVRWGKSGADRVEAGGR